MSLKLTGIFLLHSWLPTMDSHQHQQHLFHASKMEIKDKIVLLLITNIHLKLLELSSSLKQCTKLKQINILMLLIMFPVFTTMRYFHASTLLQYPPTLLAALTFSPHSPGPLALIPGSGSWQPHPLSYRLAGTQCPRSSFTNTMHSPAIHLPFSLTLWPHPFCPIPHFSFPFIHSLRSFNFLKLSPSLSLLLWLCLSANLVATGGAKHGNRLPPGFIAGHREQDEPDITKPLQSETKVVCSIIQTGATPTAASATLTLTNGQKNRWFVHSWPV